MVTDERDRLKLNFCSMINYNSFVVYVCCVVLPFLFLIKCGKSIFPLYFSELGKGAGINFHHMYTELIKFRSTFEDLPIPLTPFCLNYQGLFMVWVHWLREQQSFLSHVKLNSIKYISKPRPSIIRLLRAMREVEEKPLS